MSPGLKSLPATLLALLIAVTSRVTADNTLSPTPSFTKLLRRDDPVPSITSMPDAPLPSATAATAPTIRAVPACYGLNKPLKPYDEGGRGLELLETMKTVKCKDDGECRDVFLNDEVKERGVTETTCKKNGNNEFGVCEVKCREGWKEYDAVKGHCSVSIQGIAFYDYCCGGSFASAEGCMCAGGKSLVSSGTCEA